jgi:hypothetical protein
MAIILFNPTNEEFRTQYIGEEVIVRPGAKIRVDDARGRHVLNVLGPRGLVTLEYGDEGEGELKKAEQGRARNQEFKRKQVMDFNQLNDQRQAQRLPYIAPSETVKTYSRELGIRLFEPYSSSDEASKVHADELKKKDAEIRQKDSEIQNLSKSLAQLASKVDLLLANQPSKPAADWEALKAKIKSINRNHLQTWVKDNFAEIQGYPEDVKGLIAERWEKFYTVPFPVNEQEAQAQAA